MRKWKLIKKYPRYHLWTNGLYKECFAPGEDPNEVLKNMKLTPLGRIKQRGDPICG